MIYKKILKSIFPSFMINFFRYLNRKKGIYFSGTYPDWETAKNKSFGYDATNIKKKIIDATELVVSGKAAYEQDGHVFYKNSYSYHLISILLRAALENKNRLSVLDFGGSCGGTYFQNCDFLKNIQSLKWCVVEQKHFVEIGNANFANNIISFFNSIEDVLKQNHPNVILFSGVLQYLPEPYVVLKKAISSKADYIIIDRNPFIRKGDTRLSVQKVPGYLIKSSYPIWLFNEIDIKNIFLEQYVEVAKFNALDGTVGHGSLKTDFKCIMYKRKKNT
jgi:putative methyltransferase (TIGR04325 family)